MQEHQNAGSAPAWLPAVVAAGCAVHGVVDKLTCSSTLPGMPGLCLSAERVLAHAAAVVARTSAAKSLVSNT
jgi:hypothetical protein